MKLKKWAVLYPAFIWSLYGYADYLELKSGQRLQGRILTENAHELHMEISRTEDGSVRTVKIIQHEAVASMGRDDRGVPVEAVNRKPSEAGAAKAPSPSSAGISLEAAESYLNKSNDLLSEGRYDEAINRFRKVAAHEDLIQMQVENHEDKARVLAVRDQAYKFWLVAVKGKAEYLEQKLRTTDGRSYERRLEDLQDELRDYRKMKEDASGRRKVIRLGEDHSGPTSMDAKESELDRKMKAARDTLNQYNRWEQRTSLEIQNLENEYDLLREQSRQISRELSEARRAARRS